MGPGDWGQAVIEFADRRSAEQVAAGHLRPRLAAAEADGMIDSWFFIRKFPYWRLRYAPRSDAPRQHLVQVLDALAAEGRIIGWTAGIYEPEALAFGGAAAMDIAHELFCADSRHILDYLARPGTTPPGAPGLGQRELGILLSSVLMRGAGQDWYEQGDVWARVARHRQADHHALPAERLSTSKTAVCRLMTVDAGPASALVVGGPLAPVAGWSAAFERAGRDLADLACRGTLERGLRAVLTHHVIFHWNRLGLSHAQQGTLSTLAREVVMAEPDDAIPLAFLL
jgi:protein-L-isoaspartate(D-aspartate) O-methyltransferase